MRMSSRVRADNVRIEFTGPEDPPAWADGPDAWGDGYWWKVTLRRKRRQLTTPFYTGSAIGEPDAASVLECLCSDASGAADEPSFEAWASEYGYDTDSRRAERTYRAVIVQTAKLRAFLGDAFDAYVYETDG